VALVVCDTSPLRALNQVGLLGVLEILYGDVLVPPAVVAELSVARAGVRAFVLSAHPYVQVREASDTLAARALRARFGPGEADAIALALEVRPVAILIDDLAARSAALRLGLTPVGALGVLVRAKTAGLIPEVRAPMVRIMAELDFRMSPRLLDETLRLVGE
jgi:predicted nucleic acid-binding protein